MADFPITLSYDYFGAPGCGGSSRLSVDFSANGDLIVVDDLPSESADLEGDDVFNLGVPRPTINSKPPKDESEFRRTAIIPRSRGWRGVLEYLVANEIVALFTDGNTCGEYPWPDRMGVMGMESVASDLIAAAWSGHPVAHIAQALARLPDDVLNTLRDRCGPLRSATAIQSLLRVWQRAYDLDVPFDQIVDRAQRFNFDLPWMLRDVRALARAIEAEDRAIRIRRAWMIYPFAPSIDSLIATWRRAHPATSTNSQIGQGMRAGAIRRYVEAHVIEHGRLPVGNQKIGDAQVSPFNVDFDSLSVNSQ